MLCGANIAEYLLLDIQATWLWQFKLFELSFYCFGL